MPPHPPGTRPPCDARRRAGGTGQFAVQLAKLAGHTVIGSCSSPAKAALLKRLGADRVVDYR